MAKSKRKYAVVLDEETRQHLESITRNGRVRAKNIQHARILLMSILSRQCLDRRIADDMSLQRELQAWNTARSQEASRLTRHFTTDDARIKLRHLYPHV